MLKSVGVFCFKKIWHQPISTAGLLSFGVFLMKQIHALKDLLLQVAGLGTVPTEQCGVQFTSQSINPNLQIIHLDKMRQNGTQFAQSSSVPFLLMIGVDLWPRCRLRVRHLDGYKSVDIELVTHRTQRKLECICHLTYHGFCLNLMTSPTRKIMWPKPLRKIVWHGTCLKGRNWAKAHWLGEQNCYGMWSSHLTGGTAFAM